MDVAALALNIDSSKVVQAANDLDRFAAASDRAAASSAKVNFGNQSGSIAKLVASVQSMDAKLSSIVSTLDKVASATKAAASANDNLVNSANKAGAALAVADSHVIAYTQHLAALARVKVPPTQVAPAAPPPTSPPPTAPPPSAPAAPRSATPSFTYYGAKEIEATGQAAGIASYQAKNLFYQLNDVFVGLASGQKPMTVFIQQGSQIGQVYADTGLSVKNFGLALVGMLGILKTTTAANEAAALAQAQQAEASVAAANAQATSNVRAAETNIAIAEAQARLATTATEAAAAQARLLIATQALASGQAEATITDEALATAQAETAAAAKAAQAATVTSLGAVGIALLVIVPIVTLLVAGLAALNKQANDDSGLKKYTTAMGYSKDAVKKLNDITVTWGDTFKAVFQVGFERIISAFGLSSGDIKKAWSGVLDFLITATRAALAGLYTGLTGFAYATKRVIDNIKAGKLENPLTTLAEAGKTAYGDAQKFMDDVVKQARTNAQKRQSDLAKSLYDAPHQKKSPLTGILQGAQDDINTELTRAAAVGLSARAADEMTQRTKLLNQIQKAGIPITDGLRAKVDALSKAYADAKVAADVAKVVQDSLDSLQKQNDAINDQTATIGLYGDALNKAKVELDALTAARNALPKGETLSSTDAARITDAADKNARDQALQDQLARNEKVRKDAEDSAYALDLERAGLGLTGAAADAYSYSSDRLNDARKAGIMLSSQEISSILDAADAYGKARYAIDQQAQAIADARDVTKGFFTDFINGARQGENLAKAFGNAFSNALNKIIDKLLDKGFDGMLDKLFGSNGGGLFGSLFGGASSTNAYGIKGADNIYALGGTFGTAQRFANGGAFTNSIVTSPTLFRFANGAKMGEMGEAGPEAIMPLKRGPNGSLGVQVHGGGKAPMPSLDLGGIHQTFHLSGTMTQKDVRETAAQAGQQGAQAAVEHIRKNFQSIAQEWQMNGAVAS